MEARSQRMEEKSSVFIFKFRTPIFGLQSKKWKFTETIVAAINHRFLTTNVTINVTIRR